MTSNSNDPGDRRPDLTKRPHDGEATQGYAPPVNPYPAAPDDQFVPYTPPAYGDPLQAGYPPQHHPTQHYHPGDEHPVPQYPVHHESSPAGGMPQYPVPGFPAGAPTPKAQPAAVTATRALGAVALVAALLLITYGWLTWASFEPKFNDGGKVSVNGWGQAFDRGFEIALYPGAAGTPFTAAFIPFFVLPVAVLSILILCNVARFGNAIAILVLSGLHLVLALAFVAFPSTCIIFDDEFDASLFEETNTFSTGPGAVLTTLTLAIVVGTSIAGIILGRRKIYPGQPAAPAYSGYPGFGPSVR